ncbi:hypothetical protein D081_0596 [Anaerovibrio sp. JC8]|uniref:hypothetical protein n=1 Tax=Anaerovibrio sp. JC8 TaxID=1240085 RepID=UPI000A0E7F79|nr:hypothetical protein [Anaerovibrio sp. JC8]ORU01148.1 hypothetical protein D081_0596 [Anaerovibrio sp. JC8]
MVKKSIVSLLTVLSILFSFSLASANNDDAGTAVQQPPGSSSKSSEEEIKDSSVSRFIKFAEDDSYVYYLDKKDSGWVRRPYTMDKYVLEAWVKMVPYEYGNYEMYSPEADDSRYFLEHYLVDPQNKKIQFLCEIEVEGGRPQNNIKQRKYEHNHWESLIPESVEDTVYHAVVAKYGKTNEDNTWKTIDEIIDGLFTVRVLKEIVKMGKI